MSEAQAWKDRLGKETPEDLSRDIDIYETQLELKRQGKITNELFGETRLRRGVYGQRYDNGQRFDGQKTQILEYPCGDLEKGVTTVWDAPGMMRIKIPFGGMTSGQMDVLAEVAEEYSDGILHVTTRQDLQLHYVHIDDTPTIMRRLAAVGITTQEACGNSIRNVTACPLAGVCTTESFDVTPYADGATQFLLGHPDCQDFGRKFKIAFSGCAHEACGLTAMHDVGVIAKVENGKRGFEFYVGGGLGAVPHQAKLFYDFLPVEELNPMIQAIARVFARLGEKNNRARARLKFLIAKVGLDEFKALVEEERKILPHDDAWTAYLADIDGAAESPLKDAVSLNGVVKSDAFSEWYGTNVYAQRQPGYVVVSVTLPLGDATADQFRLMAELGRKYVKDTIRTTVEQNVVYRWVSEADVPELYVALEAAGLGGPGASSIVDVTACPGTDTCKLGIASSRGLAAELRTQLAAKSASLDEAIKNLRIKISGCFNSCGQHHVADLGFYGISRKVGKYHVPHFQVILGGQWTENAGSYGLAIGAVPSKRIPEVVNRITQSYVDQRKGTESFQDFIARVGKSSVKNMLEDLTVVPDHDVDATLYTDWSDIREFTTGDMGKGECAGEIVPLIEVELQHSERESFEAQIHMDAGDYTAAYDYAFRAMLHSAKALVRTQFLDIPEDADQIIGEFRTRFIDSKLFFDRAAGAKFANYLFRHHEERVADPSAEIARQIIEEAQLFIEAAHACYGRMQVIEA
jgi:sulfite reductase (ferredoxin)